MEPIELTTVSFLPRLLSGDDCTLSCSVAQPHAGSLRNLGMRWQWDCRVGRDGLSFQGVIARGMISLTVTRCPVLPPTSFGVTLVFTGIQEPPGTKVHGPGPAGVLLREENHLGRVQPVTGIQLAPLQQDEATPCRVKERKHVHVCACNTHVQLTEDRVKSRSKVIIPTSPSLSLVPDQGSSRWRFGCHMNCCEARNIQPFSYTIPHCLAPSHLARVFIRDTGTEKLCDGHGTASSHPATGSGTCPRNRDLLPVFSCHEIAGPLALQAVPTCFRPYSN